MKKHIALFLVITFLGMTCATYEKGQGINLEPGQKPGVKLINQKKDGQQIRGELIAVKQNSLLLRERDSWVDVTVDVGDLRFVKIVKKSKAGIGLALGPVVYLGTIIWAQTFGPSELAEQGPIFLGMTAALIGLITGAFLGIDKTIRIEGKSDSEIKEILEDLRKKARVSNFQ